MRRCFTFFILSLLVLSPALASAEVHMETIVSDASLADRATTIVVGKVLDIGPSLVDPAQTDYLIGVETVIAGEVLHSPVVVRVPSGLLDPDSRLKIYGGHLLSRGQRTLLFLSAGAEEDAYSVVDRGRGAFHVYRFAGRDVAYRTFWPQAEPYDPNTEIAHGRLRDLAAFQSWLGARVVGKTSMDYFLNADTSVLVADQPPSLSGIKLPSDKAAKFITPVSVSDPEGDADTNTLVWPSPDLVSGSIRSNSNGSALVMTIRFADGTFDEETSRGVFELNIDEDEDTGLQGIFGTTTGMRGVDFLLVFFQDDVEVRKFDPTLPPGGSLVRVVANLLATIPEPLTHMTSVPLEVLDNDEEFAFKLLVDVKFGTSFTNYTDFMPNPALPPGLVRPSAPPAPEAPSGLQATANGPDRIALSWNDNSAIEQAFDIQRRSGDGSFESIGSVGQNATSFADSSVSSGLTYTYRVRARNASGSSDWSATASATTPGEPAPSGLSAAGLSASAILLSWTDNGAAEEGYEVEMKSGDGSFAQISTLAGDSTETTVEGLDEATFYTFRVRSTGGVGTSAYSNEAGAITFFADVEPCVASATRLCLNDGRFAVDVEWENFEGDIGSAADAGLVSPDSGLLYFFDPDNWEMLLKVLDACDFNGHFWVFAAASTNVEYTLTVTDSITGFSKSYTNPLGTASPAITDTQAFATCSAQVPDPAPVLPAVDAILPAFEPGKGGTCVPSDTTMCLGEGRFQVEVDWVTDDDSGSGRVDSFQSPDSGLFWFFTASNLELMVKVLDGCSVNDRVWVFSAATTDVEYTLRVLDTMTGEEATYTNPAGTAAEAVTDIEALDSCG